MVQQQILIIAERGIGGYYGLVGAGLGAVIALAGLVLKGGNNQGKK